MLTLTLTLTLTLALTLALTLTLTLTLALTLTLTLTPTLTPTLILNQLKAHEFFSGIDWDALMLKEVPAPCTPAEVAGQKHGAVSC